MKLYAYLLPAAIIIADVVYAGEFSFEALVFNGTESFSNPDVFHFEADAEGHKHPVSRVGAQIDFKEATVTNTLTGETFKIKSGAAFLPACFSLLKTWSNGSVDDHVILKEFLNLNQSNPRQYMILAAGEWVSVKDYLGQYQQFYETQDLEKYPFITYARPVKSFAMEKGPSLDSFANALEDGLMEVHRIKSGLFIIAGQQPEVAVHPKTKKYFSRRSLPFEAYPKLHGSFSPSHDTLMWEIGKAGTSDPGSFSQLLPMLTFAAVKEAILHGVNLNNAFLVVHAPSEGHGRLYTRYGFNIVTPGPLKADDHRLGVLSLADAIRNKRFQPRHYSKKVATILSLAQRPMTDADAIRLLIQFRGQLNTELDYRAPGVATDSADARIMIQDRSENLMIALEGLFAAYGIPAASIPELQRVFSGLNSVFRDEVASQDIAFVPEQIPSDQPSPGKSLYIQDLSPELVKQSIEFAPRVLSGVYHWHRKRMAPFLSEGELSSSRFTISTTNAELVQQLVNLGGYVIKTAIRQPMPSMSSGRLGFSSDLTSVHTVTFTGQQIAAWKISGDYVQQGYWARRQGLRATIVP